MSLLDYVPSRSGLTFVEEEPRRVYTPPQPMTFEQFLDAFGEDDDVELIDGVAVAKMSAQYDHEKLYAWFQRTLGVFVDEKKQGVLLGSRTAVEITNFRGRLPDLIFVTEARRGIIRQKAIYGAPDLVIEIVSPHDRPSDVSSLETDYRGIGVTEIVFIDQRKQSVRVLRHNADATDYTESKPVDTLTFAAIPGFQIGIADLWSDPLPTPLSVVVPLLAATRSSDTVP